MKRLTMLLCLIALVFVFVGSSFATQYTVTLAEGSKSVSVATDCQVLPRLAASTNGPGHVYGACNGNRARLDLYASGDVIGPKETLTYAVNTIHIIEISGWWNNGYYQITVFYPDPD